MNLSKKISKGVVLIILFCASLGAAVKVEAQPALTREEQDYVKEGNIIQAVSLDGAAPLQYSDANGEVRGISKEVLEEISKLTGLVFEYRLYDTLQDAFNSGADLFFGIPHHYAPEGMVLSLPYLESETILYMNSSINPTELADKKFAAVRGSDLPQGISEKNAVYFDTREASMDAVERGLVDYGYGNAFSVAFYQLQNSYNNLITVPEKKESRAYAIGFLKENEILGSIINKFIASLDESRMSTLVLNVATQVDRKITVPMIFDSYGVQIFGAIAAVMAVMLLSVIHNIRAKNELKLQYDRYHILSQTSNEYLYEYHVKTQLLELSKNCRQLFGDADSLEKLKAVFKQVLGKSETAAPLLELPTADGETGIFKCISSPIFDKKGRVYSIIGKLVDVSREEAEKQELIRRSQIDGLSGLYNASTAKRLISERMASVPPGVIDALVVIDCDNFKEINDTHGHLEGDMSLLEISESLRRSFRKTDIIGRIGGDEFCVYMLDVPAQEFAAAKCRQLMDLVKESSIEHQLTVSIGISLLDGEETYDELFAKADQALYDAKRRGRNQIQFYEEE